MDQQSHSSRPYPGLQEYQDQMRHRKRARQRKKGTVRGVAVVVAVVIFQVGVIGGILLMKRAIQRPPAPPAVGTAVLNTVPSPALPPAAIEQVSHPPQTEVAVQPKQSAVKDGTPPARAAVKNEKAAKLNATSKARASSPVPRVKASRSTPLAAGRRDDAIMSYAAGMISRIERYKDYPAAARKAGLQGRCIVVCIVRRDGSIIHTEVVKSSGSVSLDNAAIRSVKKVGRFPAIPDTIKGDEVSFDIPLNFRTSGS